MRTSKKLLGYNAIDNPTQVYREFANAKEDHPNSVIVANEVPHLTSFVDDQDLRTTNFYVDIPQVVGGMPSDEWKNVAKFKNRQAAIDYAAKYFHADNNGCVSLISHS